MTSWVQECCVWSQCLHPWTAMRDVGMGLAPWPFPSEMGDGPDCFLQLIFNRPCRTLGRRNPEARLWGSLCSSCVLVRDSVWRRCCWQAGRGSFRRKPSLQRPGEAPAGGALCRGQCRKQKALMTQAEPEEGEALRAGLTSMLPLRELGPKREISRLAGAPQIPSRTTPIPFGSTHVDVGNQDRRPS